MVSKYASRGELKSIPVCSQRIRTHVNPKRDVFHMKCDDTFAFTYLYEYTKPNSRSWGGTGGKLRHSLRLRFDAVPLCCAAPVYCRLYLSLCCLLYAGSNNDSFELLKEHSESHCGHRVGIAHTRWATHGAW